MSAINPFSLNVCQQYLDNKEIGNSVYLQLSKDGKSITYTNKKTEASPIGEVIKHLFNEMNNLDPKALGNSLISQTIDKLVVNQDNKYAKLNKIQKIFFSVFLGKRPDAKDIVSMELLFAMVLDPVLLKYASRKVMLNAVEENGQSLKYVSDNLKNDCEVV